MGSASCSFDLRLQQQGFGPLQRWVVKTVQLNVGKICNQACHHCHVEAGPKRTEIMTKSTSDRVIQLLHQSVGIEAIDITGGAPELNPNFRDLVEQCRCLGLHVIDRCNLTILLEPGFEDLGSFLARNEVEIIASLPCYTAENVDKQRGRGVFRKSIEALQLLNGLGYGRSGFLPLNLVYNPLGPSLPPPQAKLEAEYKQHLRDEFGIEFNSLFTITNMPIRRFSEQLIRIGQRELYQELLSQNFNPETVEHLMCRSQISIGWDGNLYDCDFNQMLELRTVDIATLWDIESFDSIAPQRIVTGVHCFGCTAGSGSSCSGTLA
ncbi:MAG TPA: arsenosugar biosynthesis radical SAM (seleno)protein ArsS [Bryobacteraceae bacterium]|nr:arsenosugar biosynthesis radical SAM (seleno)protein ArsS [Bryobacteraceae bacterium]